MVVSMARAVRLARSNGRRREDLLERHRAVEGVLGAEAALAATSRTAAYAALVELTAVFSRVRGAQLHELAESAGTALPAAPHVALPSVRPAAGGALLGLAGGAAAGSAAGALTVSAVGALATASTGTAISGLSGAAASSATLAWLGGGAWPRAAGEWRRGPPCSSGWWQRRWCSPSRRCARCSTTWRARSSGTSRRWSVRSRPARTTPPGRRCSDGSPGTWPRATCTAEVVAAAPNGSVGALVASDHAVARARRFLASHEDARVAS